MRLLTDAPKTYQKLFMAHLIKHHSFLLNNNLRRAKELGLITEIQETHDSRIEIKITDPYRCHRKRNFYESQDGNFYKRIAGRLSSLYKLCGMKYGEHREQALSCNVDK
jgi:hypothetical protein